MNDVPNITLNDGHVIPQFGFGVFQVPPAETAEATLAAFEAGYRHIDTAEMYGNEKEVGEAVAKSGLARADVFITSKLNNGFQRPDDARRAFADTLAALDSDYVDLFLIHWPLPARGLFVDAWKTLEEFKADGRARSIGVSNFEPAHLQRLFDECEIVPAVNQIEVHPYFAQTEVRAFCAEHQIAVEAWAPIAQGRVLGEPVLAEIGQRVGKSPAQVVLRWHIQRGDIVFPKTTGPARMRENIDVFDFVLADADMAAIDGLDRDGRNGPHPDALN